MHVGTLAQPVAGSNTGASPTSPRLVKAAHEFESQMMKELLKPMNGSGGLSGDDDDSDSGSNTALGDFASEALGRSLSEHGGLGIANSIMRSLSQAGKTK